MENSRYGSSIGCQPDSRATTTERAACSTARPCCRRPPHLKVEQAADAVAQCEHVVVVQITVDQLGGGWWDGGVGGVEEEGR